MKIQVMQVMSLTSSIYDPFYHLTFNCDLDLQPTNLRFFFMQNPNLKKEKFFFWVGCMWGGGMGGGERGGER